LTHYVYTSWQDAYDVNHLTFSRQANVLPAGAVGLASREAVKLRRDVLVFEAGRLVASGKYDPRTGKASGRAI